MLDKLPISTIAAIFEALPVEISFVDDQDTVRYFNKGSERIFPRPASVIGRKVQNCHPTKSVDVVDRILAEFRSGRRDSAEFWIDHKGRKVYIRYLAVRDPAGKYLGCLEVTQDITEIKAIGGEKRLLDWK